MPVPGKVPRPLFSAPWRTPGGRFSRLKAIVFGLCFAPALYIGWQWWAGRLGGRPDHHAMLETGFWAIRFLILCLAVTPARILFDWPRAAQLRRMLGIAAAAYTIAHILFYAADEGFALGFVLNQMFTVFYLILGTIATIGLVLLAATSTDRAMGRMGRNWKRLHRLIYPIGLLSLWHFFLTQKIEITIAAVPAGLFLWLMLWRAEPVSLRRSWAGLIAISLAAVILTALGEAGWYAFNSGIDPRLVLAANFSLARFSPAALVAADLALLLALVSLRRSAGIRPRPGIQPRAKPG